LPYNIPYEEAKKLLEKFMIFDNKNLTILNKPAGYSVQGGDDYDKNLFSIMAAKYKREMIHVIHRLDKPTSGVLFFCKNLRTAQLIQRAI
jgi:23S rRNA-/tRNA-specific pseudouridylate synthase